MNRLLTLLLCCAVLLCGCGRKDEPAAVDDQIPDAVQEETGRAEEATVSDGGNGLSHGVLEDKPTGDYLEINEKIFIAQINDIYLNTDDYIGKTIRYEGIYMSEIWPLVDGDEEIHYVVRYGPGCCGNDGNAGFEVAWDGEYPEQNDWVEVEGVLDRVMIGEYYFLQLQLESMEVKEERGMEYVAA